MLYHILAIGDVTSEAGTAHLARHLRQNGMVAEFADAAPASGQKAEEY